MDEEGWWLMTRHILRILLAFFLVFSISDIAYTAPLLDDVPADHWAHDAVAGLTSRGLLEGYPDGLFKGDRAATRNEMAMAIARLLARNDQQHAGLATKTDVENFKKLSDMLRDELESQGVQAAGLEETLKRLRMRVNRK